MSGGNGGTPALEVAGLNAFYGKSQVVFDLGLTIARGETVTLLGRNGAGKTSTLLALAGVVSSRAETIRLAGRELSRLPAFRRVRNGLALVPSGARSFPNLTVRENLELARSGARRGRGWTTEDVFDTFPALEALADADAGTLSGGERQMLAVGRALVSGPEVLMLDEPSEGLAPLILREIAAQVQAMNERGISVLLAEQSHRFALATAHRAVFVEKGRIMWEGATADAADEDVLGRFLSV